MCSFYLVSDKAIAKSITYQKLFKLKFMTSKTSLKDSLLKKSIDLVIGFKRRKI